jgi:phosphoglycolate phosphatase
MKFGAVIFDLDGTLLNTLDDIADSANAVLRARGYPEYPVEDYKIFVGNGVQKLIERVLPEGAGSPALVGECVLEMRDEYSNRWNRKTRPYDGVPAMLDHLRTRSVKTAILSNKPDDFTKRCAESLLPGRSFDVVLGHREGFPHKPDPASALGIARTLGLPPADILFVGDSGIDVETAVNAGMYPAGVLWGYRSGDELKQSGANQLFERPGDISTFVDGDTT